MKSMTGFGKGEACCHERGVTFSVEISTVNRKQLDIRANMPRELGAFETILRRIISARVKRGTVAARVTMELEDSASAGNVKINEALLRSLASHCASLTKSLGLKNDLKLSELLAVPGVIEERSTELDVPECVDAFSHAAEKAVDALLTMRIQEGKALQNDLRHRVGVLDGIVDKIAPHTHDIPELQKEKLLTRIKESGLDVADNDERLLKEIVIFADKSDVSEELTRLKSHFKQFTVFIEDDSTPVGRSLDFLLQEIQREINTLGTKAGGTVVSPLVVEFKTELEKIREQVQNIE